MARRPQSGTYRARTALGRGRGRRHGIRSKGRRVMWGALGAAVLGWLLLAPLIMIGRHGATLRALWREPVLRRPVLFFVCVEWGPGDATHAEALRRLCVILGRYRDAEGHHPVMTLGMVLALPDRERMRVEKNMSPCPSPMRATQSCAARSKKACGVACSRCNCTARNTIGRLRSWWRLSVMRSCVRGWKVTRRARKTYRRRCKAAG